MSYAINQSPIAVAYGMGTNSTGMLVGLQERGIRPDLILSADTGDERPHTYEHRDVVSEWCKSVGFPEIVTVRKGGLRESLSENCTRMLMLPSIAYGFKGCSMKYKRAPQDKYINNWEPARLAWESGRKVVKLIGYDADEERRAKITSDSKYDYQYPLIEWGFGRDECVAAIARAGLPQPGKSACFFCPSSTREEIEQLKAEYPVLFYRALDLERNAEGNLNTVAGLGRRFSWHEHEDTDEAKSFAERARQRYVAGRVAAKERKRVESGIEQDCGCYDG